MKLIIARHGQTEWNSDKKLQGDIDIPLNEVGLAQAEKLAEELRYPAMDAIYTSKLLRASMTADPIADWHQLELIQDARLNEFDWGIFKGIPAEERDVHPELGPLWKSVQSDIRSAVSHEGELFHDFERRVHSVLDDITEKHEAETVLIVAHGFVKRVLVAHALKQAYETMEDKYWNNAGYSILDRGRDGFEINVLNHTDHL